MKKMIKKVIAPVLVITVLFTVLRPFCIQDGKCNYFLLLLLMGIPFGIGKMCVWMVPRGFDLGGTLAVWTMNFLIGGLIGSVVLLAMIGQAIIYLSVFLLTVITGIHKIREHNNCISYSHISEGWCELVDKRQNVLEKLIIEEAIGEFMDLLTDRQRQVIHQIYFQQRTQREVSRVFGITEPAVSKCISQAKQKMRRNAGRLTGVLQKGE